MDCPKCHEYIGSPMVSYYPCMCNYTAPNPLTTDFTQMKYYDKIKDIESFKHFQASLKNKAYGGEALEDAWVWFLEGWNACAEDNDIREDS